MNIYYLLPYTLVEEGFSELVVQRKKSTRVSLIYQFVRNHHIRCRVNHVEQFPSLAKWTICEPPKGNR